MEHEPLVVRPAEPLRIEDMVIFRGRTSVRKMTRAYEGVAPPARQSQDCENTSHENRPPGHASLKILFSISRVDFTTNVTMMYCTSSVLIIIVSLTDLDCGPSG